MSNEPDAISDCPFCKRVADGNYRLTGDREIVSFEPLNPVVQGHMLFIPRLHFEHPSMAPTGQATAAAELYASVQGWDYNLITSSGAAATQTVPHIHIHYVPRRTDDGLHLPWTGQQRTVKSCGEHVGNSKACTCVRSPGHKGLHMCAGHPDPVITYDPGTIGSYESALDRAHTKEN